jgi:uncharacterized DUF497 family protein
MGLGFEWDDRKAIANIKKHGVSFDEASTLFHDPLARIFDDKDHSYGEAREIIIGHSSTRRLLLVSFVEGAKNLIRIISARQPTPQERSDYEKNRSH